MKENDNQSIIRGASAFFILLTHISNFTKPSCILRAFTNFGYLWVGIFFFYTGYNLFNSYLKKNNFFTQFWWKKLIRIYIPLILSNILFIIIKIFLYDKTYTSLEIVENVLGLVCINDVNWYIYAVLIFYFSAWLILRILSLFKKYRQNKRCLLISSFIIFFLYSFIYYNIAMRLHLTASIRNVYPLTLLFGAIYALYKNFFTKIIENPFVYEIAIIILFFATCTLHYANMNHYRFFIFDVEKIDYLVPITFTLLILLISVKVNLKSIICMSIDKISLETYIFHYVILCLYSNSYFTFKSNYLFLLVYLITVIGISYVVHNLVSFLLSLRCKNKTIFE